MMRKNKWGGSKWILLVMLCLLHVCGCSMDVRALEKKSEGEGKLIYFVYDNSGSMVQGTRNWGSQAQYAVKAFCEMSNEKDEIRFYCVGDYNRPYKFAGEIPETDKNGEPRSPKNRNYTEALDGILFNGRYTYYTAIHQAIEDIKKEVGEKDKWVVMFTDGTIEKRILEDDGKIWEGFLSTEEFQEYLKEDLEGRDVEFCFVELNPKGIQGILKETDYISRYVNDKNNITESILSVIEKIYGRRKLAKGSSFCNEERGKLVINFDFPVSDIMVLFENGRTVDDETNLKWYRSIKGEQKETEEKNNDETDGEEKSDDEKDLPQGVIASYDISKLEKHDKKSSETEDNAFEYVEYIAEINIPEGTTNYTIYYTPKITPVVTMEHKNSLLKDGTYVEGEYSVYLDAVNPATNKKISRESVLLGEEQGKVIIDGVTEDLAFGNHVLKQIEPGEVTVEATTPFGDFAKTTFQIEKDLEKYKMWIESEQSPFYYNALEDKKNALCVSVVDDNGDVIDNFGNEKLTVEFWQGEKKSQEITYEQVYDADKQEWKIYPLLKNEKNRSASGDLLCKISMDIRSDIYKNPIIYSQEIEMEMDTEDDLLEMVIPEQLKCPSQLLFTLWPIRETIIPVEFSWNGIPLKKYEIDEFYADIEIISEDGVEEKSVTDIDDMKIKNRIKYFRNQPREIRIRSGAVYTAFGKTENVEAVQVVEIRELAWGVKVRVVVIEIFIVLFLIVIFVDIWIYIKWCRNGKPFLRKLRVDRRYSDSNAWWDVSVKTRRRRWFWLIFKDYHYDVSFDIPCSCDLKPSRINVQMQIKCTRDGYEVKWDDGNKIGGLSANGNMIGKKYTKIPKDTELILYLPQGRTQILRIEGEKS